MVRMCSFSTAAMSFVLATLSMAAPVGALQERPILADAVKAAIARDGSAAAEREFMTILETRALDYDYDPRRMMALLQACMEAGEMESAQVVMRLASAYSLQATRAALPPGALPDPPPSAQRTTAPREDGAAQVGEEAAARARMLAALGEARTDLGRFGGIYGQAPDGDGGRRTFFVTVTCEGHLMVGPMWADIAPWRMRSLGDTEFRWAGDNSADPIRATFATGQDGTATGLTVDLDNFTDPMIRLSDLDPGWQPRCPPGG